MKGSKKSSRTKPAKTTKGSKAPKPPLVDSKSVGGRELRQALASVGSSRLVPTPVTTGPAKKEAAKVKPAKAQGKLSGLDAAAKVLSESGKAMRCVDMIKVMLEKGYWSTSGKTPAATLYSAILREIDGKPGESRFAKTGKGLFALASSKK